MSVRKKLTRFLLIGTAAVTLSAAALAVVVPVTGAAAAELEGPGRPFGRFLDGIDVRSFLADELGITVDALGEAQDAAHGRATQQAIDEGLITQDQADIMTTMKALRDYMNRDELLAESMGITVDELQAALDGDKSMADLMDELGLDRETVAANMQAAQEAAIQQAVDDGVITQEQADEILSSNNVGLLGGRGVGGFMGEHGGPRGERSRPMGNGDPDTDPSVFRPGGRFSSPDDLMAE